MKEYSFTHHIDILGEMIKYIGFFVLLLECNTAYLQLPKCNLYQLKMVVYENEVKLSDPLYLTPYNAEGYNNQPYFINSEEIIFTSDYHHTDSTDLWVLNIDEEELYQFTNTAGYSEYSPKNGIDRDKITTVRVDKDGKSQFLWQYPLDRSNTGSKLIANLADIGYYHFISDEEVVLFQVGEPHRLSIYNFNTKKAITLIENPGRTFTTDKNDNLLFVHKIGNTNFLKSINLTTKKAKTITVMPEATEDFLLINDNLLLSAKGSKILKFSIDLSQDWEEVIDLKEMEIDNINRMITNRNRLIFVAD